MARLKIKVITKKGKKIVTKSSTKYKGIRKAKLAIPELRDWVNYHLSEAEGEKNDLCILDKIIDLDNLDHIEYSATYF